MFARRRCLRAGVLIGLLALPSLSRGAILTFTMEGTITTVNDPLGLLTFAEVNDEVAYTFLFDSETPDTNSTPTLGMYQAISADLRVKSLGFGPGPGNLPSPMIDIHHPSDSYEVSSWFSLNVPGLESAGFTYFLLDDELESNALTGTTLPAEPLDLNLFALKEFSIQFIPVEGGHDRPILSLSGTITSFTPEPASLAAMALGLGLWARPRRGLVR